MVKPFRYSREMIEFLHQGFMQMSVALLTVKFNAHYGLDKSPATIASTLKNRGIKCGRNTGQLNKGIPRTFTLEQKAWCIKNYPSHSRKSLTAEFNKVFNDNRRLSQIVGFLKNNKITSGNTGYFEKGQKSWNHGSRGVMKNNVTSFKKGQVPANWLPVGSERVVEGGYIEVKTAEPHTWTAKARVIWQELHGEIPEKCKVRFKNGNPADLRPDNLFVVSPSEHMILNHLQFSEHPPETKDTVILIAKVHAKNCEVLRG